MAEFGLGNLLSLYGAIKISRFFIGTGAGYLYYDDEEYDTSTHIFEPAILIAMPYRYFQFRLKAGICFAKEKEYNIKKNAFSFSPEALILIKNIYAGIGLPVIIGKEGAGISFSLGAGYQYPISF